MPITVEKLAEVSISSEESHTGNKSIEIQSGKEISLHRLTHTWQ